MVEIAKALERCTEWVLGFEMAMLRRRMPKAHEWHRVSVSLVITAEQDNHSAAFAVDVRNLRTGRSRCRMPHASGWQDTHEKALRTIAREVAGDALAFGADIFEGLENVQTPLIISGTSSRPAFPVTLLGSRHASGSN